MDASEILGAVFKNGSAILLARVVGADAAAIVPDDVEAAEYTIYLIDPRDPDADTPVAGHTAVEIDPDDLLFNAPQADALWDVDAVGYNFKHELDVSANQAFSAAGRNYRIVFTLTPADGGQPILVRFRVNAL